MDQIRPVLLFIIRNRFWITCVLVAGASLITWYMAWQAIDAQRAEQEQKIKGKKSAIDSVLATTVPTGVKDEVIDAHPNQSTQKRMNEKIDLASDSALEAWEARYDQQKDVLVFAEEIPGAKFNLVEDEGHFSLAVNHGEKILGELIASP